jgi:hypothetical protein
MKMKKDDSGYWMAADLKCYQHRDTSNQYLMEKIDLV